MAVLVFPVFMVLTQWTYVVHMESNFSYPYDMPSLALFAGGLLAIYRRSFVPLLLIMLFGTMNRETRLFLIGIYILDSASQEISAPSVERTNNRILLRERFRWQQVSWSRTFALLSVWLVVKLTLDYHFRANDN